MESPLVLTGPWRQPHNDLVTQSYGGHSSLHDADQAGKLLGTRKAPIHGPMHLLHVLGPDWFVCATISVDFRKMISYFVPVQEHMELPPEGKHEGCNVRVWLSFKDGEPALEGPASLGSTSASMVSQQIAKVKAPAAPLRRIL